MEEIAAAFAPVLGGPLQEVASGLRDSSLQGLVGTEDQRARLLHHEGDLVLHEGHRDVGRQAQGDRRQDVADMVAALGGLRHAGAVFGDRPEADAGIADHRLDDAHRHGRTVNAPELLEPRCEIGDLHRRSVGIVERGGDDRRVVPIALLAAREVIQLDLVDALIVVSVVSVQQGAEHGIAVKAWQAGPHDTRTPVDQRAEATIADRRDIEIVHPASSVTGSDFGGGGCRHSRQPFEKRVHIPALPPCRAVRGRADPD